MSFRISPQETERLHRAILDRFNRASFTQFLLFKLKKRFSAITSNASFDVQVFDVLTRADDEGWTEKLISALVISRPNEPVFTAARQHFAGRSQEPLGQLEPMPLTARQSSIQQQGVASLAPLEGSRPPRFDPFGSLGPVHRSALRQFQEILESISRAIAGRNPGEGGGVAFRQIRVVLEASSLLSDEEVLDLLEEATDEMRSLDDPGTAATAITALGARACARAKTEGRYDDAVGLARTTQDAYYELLAILESRPGGVSDMERTHWRIEKLTWQMQQRLADLLSDALRRQDRRRQQLNVRQEQASEQPRQLDQRSDMVNARSEERTWESTNATQVQSQRT